MANGKTPRRRKDDYPDDYPEDEIRDRRRRAQEVDNDRRNGPERRRVQDRDYYDDRDRYDYRDRDDRYRYRDRDYRDRDTASWLWPLLAVLLLLIFGWLILQNYQDGGININQNQDVKFENENKTGNFEKSNPENQQTVAEPPAVVLVQTNSQSSNNSSVSINKDGRDYGQGNTSVFGNGLVMARTMDPNAPDGLYTVNYRSCGQDGRCQEGSYQFTVNWSSRENFSNQTGQSQVNILYDGQKLNPENLIISKGTKINLVNNSNQEVEIFSGGKRLNELFPQINADLSRGTTVSFTINQPGSYPYTFKLNNNEVKGQIIVQ